MKTVWNNLMEWFTLHGMVKKILFAAVTLIIFVLSLFYFKVIWRLAPYYEVREYIQLEVPVMDMEAYKSIAESHRRPYIYSIQSAKGEVCIVGISHTKDPNNPSLDSLRDHWKKFKPDVVLVEGNVGNLITWFQDPVKKLGEGGLATHLAHQDHVELYSWEPKKEKEIEILRKDFTAEEMVMFYSFRPYWGNKKYGKYKNDEAELQDCLKSRTAHTSIEDVFTSWQELDKKWKADFPGIDWRTYEDKSGYPPGYLNNIWNRSNLIRDVHMIMVIIELVKAGKRVFVTMGASHAPRIEQTLLRALR